MLFVGHKLFIKEENVITVLSYAFYFGLGVISYSVTKEYLLEFSFNLFLYFPVC